MNLIAKRGFNVEEFCDITKIFEIEFLPPAVTGVTKDGDFYQVGSGEYSTWVRQGKLNVSKLVQDSWLTPTDHPIIGDYQRCKIGLDRDQDVVFIGQSDENNCPNGIVRVIYDCGWIYEGQIDRKGML